MNLSENIQRIHEVMGLSDNVIDKNIIDKRLSNILKNIEKKTGKKFTQKHFDDERNLSGDVKIESGGYNKSALEAFKNLQKVCKGLSFDEDSYRTYERQGELFQKYVEKYGSIEGAMKLRSIPGFSQHHTGKAFDIEEYDVRDCVMKNASKFGFIFPYINGGIRGREPWHIYYTI